MSEVEYDVIVIGSGPGGEGAAMRAVKAGKSAAMVEKFSSVGGGCTHWGTIPSKTLRQAVHALVEFKSHPIFRQAAAAAHVSYPGMLERARSVIENQTRVRRGFYSRNRVDVLHGKARFLDEHTIQVEEEGGAEKVYKAKAFIVAVGSRPYHPPDIDFSHARIKDSDSILRMNESPRSITIYGAGVIGCEYASIFRNMDVKVNLINTRGKLLEFLDDEIIDALSYHLRDEGVLIRHNEEYAKVEPADDGVVLHLKSGKQLKTDVLLWANGRSGNTEDLGLRELGVEIDHRGNIVVDADYRTALKHVYAVGDVVGFPSLASASYDQGRFAAGHLVDGTQDTKLIEDIPTGIYTSPEISSVGKNERELTAEKVPYEVGHAMFRNLARAQITGNTVGMLKLLFHRETLEILGIHCFGYQASEILHIGQAIMAQPGEANTLRYFIDTTFNYPTMAEAYRVAALNGMNRVW